MIPSRDPELQNKEQVEDFSPVAEMGRLNVNHRLFVSGTSLTSQIGDRIATMPTIAPDM